MRRIAFHEAGHAWMMVREGLGVRFISSNSRESLPGDNRGVTVPELCMEERQRALSEKFAKAALAGSAAEQFLLGNWDEEGLLASAFDTGRARSYLTMSGDDWKTDALNFYVQALSNAVMDEIARPGAWHAITSLAYELLKAGSLEGDEVLEILTEC
jgi:hypothetical protein